ncbi:MAG: ABC transporter permease [Burkholderia sp.]
MSAGASELRATSAEAAAGARPAQARLPRPHLDRVGVPVALLIAAALAFAPFVTFRENRIVAGNGLGLADVFGAREALLLQLTGALAIGLVLLRSPAVWRAVFGFAMLLGLGTVLGQVPVHLAGEAHPLARVSPASGAWLLAFAFAILVVDALARLRLAPPARLAVLAGVLVALGALFHAGWWDGLSVMQEYALRKDSFRQEALRHLALSGASVLAAMAVGLPAGIACARSAALCGLLLPLLNGVQTIPSIALYGLLMVPLGLLAARVPLAAELGISGIGAVPALVALFLYALLPIVSGTAIGLLQLPAQTREAAVAMGMSSTQRLLAVELPIALPVILGSVRIVLVQNIGLTSVAALIGGGGFGTFIFQGIGQSADDLVLLGAIPTIALTLVAAVLFEAAIAFTRGTRQ